MESSFSETLILFVKGILTAHVLVEISALVLPALDGAVLSVSLVFFHEGISTLGVIDGLRVSWFASGPCREYSRAEVVL